MAKRFSILIGCLILLCSETAFAYEVRDLAGENYYPEQGQWTYHYTYAYPQLAGDENDAVAMTVNETFALILSEMRDLAMPMFAASPEMTEDGRVEVDQHYRVTCLTERIFSVLLIKTETRQDGSVLYAIEPEVFDIGGDYAGETLTLRGLVRVGDSSDQLAEAVMEDLYRQFLDLQAQGVCRADVTRGDFFEITAPTLDFYADENENAVFFLQPELMVNPSADVPAFVYTPEALLALVEQAP